MNTKKILAVLMAAGLLVSFSACGKKTPATSATEAPVTSIEETEEITEETSDESSEESSEETTEAAIEVVVDENGVPTVTLPDDTNEYPEGPIKYKYCIANITATWNEKDVEGNDIPRTAIVKNIRLVQNKDLVDENGNTSWIADDTGAYWDALDAIAASQGWGEPPRGSVQPSYEVLSEFESSAQYQTAMTWDLHKADGDEYELTNWHLW